MRIGVASCSRIVVVVGDTNPRIVTWIAEPLRERLRRRQPDAARRPGTYQRSDLGSPCIAEASNSAADAVS